MPPSVIYEPRGRAREYAPLAVNLYRGCSHGCVYCYAPGCTYTKPEKFHGDPQPRPNILKRLEADAFRLARDPRMIQLCFTCDPYQPIEKKQKVTRQALGILARRGLRPRILTKAGADKWLLEDLDLIKYCGGELGITLTCLDPALAAKIEPGASPPDKRIALLKAARKRGIPTWVSFEPVIWIKHTMKAMAEVSMIANRVAFGKLNGYSYARANADFPGFEPVDWPSFVSYLGGAMSAFRYSWTPEMDEPIKGDRFHFYLKSDLLGEAA